MACREGRDYEGTMRRLTAQEEMGKCGIHEGG